ncbi:MAG TPA: HAD-IIA family hydrolase [Bordetella sp.]|nr:HAD-IIA family hydrolase [Bordetella sp.]
MTVSAFRPRLSGLTSDAANASALPWTATCRALILDLDGTLMREREVVEGAADLLRTYEDRYVVVSNNSTHTAAQMARRLRLAGLTVLPDRLVLAGEMTIQYLRARHPDARVMLYASVGLRRYAQQSGCHLVNENADIVVLALDKRFSYVVLERITRELTRGAQFIASNADASHPGPDGWVVPETGALMQAVMTSSGCEPAHVVGKPGPAMFEEGLRRLGRPREEVVVIGDNPDTDALGAVRAGLRYLLVGDGEYADALTLADLMRCASPAHTAMPEYPVSSASRTTHRRCS